jgi:hypothetical protein
MEQVKVSLLSSDLLAQGYELFGGVLRDSVSKEVKAFVRERAGDLLSKLPNVFTGEMVSKLPGAFVSGVSGIGVLNLGLSTMGLALVLKRVKQIEQRLEQTQKLLQQVNRKLDLSFYANFRAALDLASNAFTMASVENRKASAMHAINRLMEAKHYYAGETDSQLAAKTAVVDAYLATLSLSYVAEARCYLELEELDTARQLLDAGATYLDARVRYYVHVLLTSNPSAYLHPSLKGKVDLQRLTKVFQWFRPELDERTVFEEQRENIFNLAQNQEQWIQTLPLAIWDPIINFQEKSTLFSKFDAFELFGSKRSPVSNTKVYERLATIIEEIEAIIEDMQRFHAYRMEVQAIQKLNLSFSQWQQLAPPADSTGEPSGLMMITLPKPLMLTS